MINREKENKRKYRNRDIFLMILDRENNIINLELITYDFF